MPSIFESKKANSLEQLAVPDSAYHDASLKSSIDVGIRDLDPNAGAGRKGGGQWSFVSHDPLAVPHERQEKDLTSMLAISASDAISVPFSTQNTRWVRCKFEPMILHVLCSSFQSAQRVRNAATSAGFAESGISSITPQPDGSTTVMTAVRTTGVALDSVVDYENSRGKPVPMVDEAYMNVLVELANERFAVNIDRTERSRKVLVDQFVNDRKDIRREDGGACEPADIRKARMRAEELARKPPAHDQANTTQRRFQDVRSTTDATGLHAAPP